MAIKFTTRDTAKDAAPLVKARAVETEKTVAKPASTAADGGDLFESAAAKPARKGKRK